MQSLQGWQPHKANEKKQKDYGIMQKNKCKAIAKFAIYFLHPSGLIPFPFGFFITLATDCIFQFYIMSVHSSIPSDTTPTACTCGAPFSGSMAPVSRYAFQRFVRKRFFSCSPSVGVRVYLLPCACCLWVHSTGQRFLCTLPF